LQVLCFLLLSHWEPDFFRLHFYRAIVYLALIILLFYMEDRWVYMMVGIWRLPVGSFPRDYWVPPVGSC
jgi:hypothetical protein